VTTYVDGLFEEPIELARDDGVVIPAVRLVPDWEPAEQAHGAGVVVVAGGALGEDQLARVARPLARRGYFVIAFGLGGDLARGVDEVHAALLALRPLAGGRLGVVALAGAGGVALEAATTLPRIDAVVHLSGPLPRLGARLARVRAAIELHRATAGAAISDDDVAAFQRAIEPARVGYVVRRHPVGDGFFDHPAGADQAHEAVVAWDQAVDFLAVQLT
jgi:dienelactone hydrolase